MADDDDDQIICATYTHARRHPMVLGNIGGWTPPFQLTLVQVAVLIVAYVVEMQTWRWWGAKLPMTVGVVLAAGVPCLLAWAVRRTRIEGRSLPRLVVGWARFAVLPRRGVVGGRPYRPARPSTPLRSAVYVAPGWDER
jgi:hypothetical protein